MVARQSEGGSAGTWVPDKLCKAEAARESVTFREYAVDWAEHLKKPDGTDLKETAKQKYRESLDLYLLPFFGDMLMTAITPKDVQRWYDEFRPMQLHAGYECGLGIDTYRTSAPH